MTQNILFICSKNQWRSPTAETVFGRDPRVCVRSAGVSRRAKKTVSFKDIEWADLIFVMENKHRQRLQADFNSLLVHKKLIVLNIPDDYEYMDAELVALLEDGVEQYL